MYIVQRKSEDRVNSSQIRNKNHQLIDDDDDALMGSLSAVRTSWFPSLLVADGRQHQQMNYLGRSLS